MAEDKNEIDTALLGQHPIAIRLGSLTEGTLQFYEENVNANDDKSLAAVEEKWKKYPKACAAKLRIGTTILGKTIPNRSMILNKTNSDDKPNPPKPVNLTRKQIQDLKLTDEQLAAFAGIDIEIEAEK